MSPKPSASRLKLSTFKLNSLLSITNAINENLTVENLLQRYERILRDDLNIGKILIYKNEDGWKCMLQSGIPDDNHLPLDVEHDLLHYNEITFVTSSQNEVLAGFDIVIPVHKNNVPLAYVLIGDIDEEGEGVSPTIKHLNFVQTLSNIIMVAIENIRLFNESLRQEAMRKELELASKMQNMLIPDKEKLPKNNLIHITAFYQPHLEVGGDYYDCIVLDKNEVGFCIADVSGKGISAALLMSNFQANLRALFSHEITMTALLEKLNTRVMEAAGGEKFITLFIAKYNYKSRELTYVNAGHNPPILYGVKSEKLQYLKTGCVGMGMLDEIPNIKQGIISMKERSKLLCYTDGLVELIDGSGVEFGTHTIEENISNQLAIEDNIKYIIEKQNIIEGSTAIFDDISIIAAEFF
ncbi:MAG: GAF domain-containing SpoIIE family protein phosphatase [Bacteroidota bacterium]